MSRFISQKKILLLLYNLRLEANLQTSRPDLYALIKLKLKIICLFRVRACVCVFFKTINFFSCYYDTNLQKQIQFLY